MYATPSETTAGNSISEPSPRDHTTRNGGRSRISRMRLRPGRVHAVHRPLRRRPVDEDGRPREVAEVEPDRLRHVARRRDVDDAGAVRERHEHRPARVGERGVLPDPDPGARDPLPGVAVEDGHLDLVHPGGFRLRLRLRTRDRRRLRLRGRSRRGRCRRGVARRPRAARRARAGRARAGRGASRLVGHA